MKNKDIVKIYSTIIRLPHDLKNAKFNYAMEKNRRLLEKKVMEFNDATKPDQGFFDYDNARVQLCIEYAEKNDKNEPILENGTYKIPEDKMAELTNKIDELRKQEPHATALKNHEELIAKYEALLEEESGIEPFKIQLENVPNELPKNFIDSLYDIIVE